MTTESGKTPVKYLKVFRQTWFRFTVSASAYVLAIFLATTILFGETERPFSYLFPVGALIVGLMLLYRGANAIELSRDRITGPASGEGWDRTTIIINRIKYCLILEAPTWLPRPLRHRYFVVCSREGQQIILDPWHHGSAPVKTLLAKIGDVPLLAK